MQVTKDQDQSLSYHAVLTNSRALKALRHNVTDASPL